MAEKNFQKIYIFLFTTIIVNIVQASKCGEYFCDEKSECTYNPTKSELNCICEEGYIKNISEKYVYCHQAENISDQGKCLNVGEICGPYHVCNSDLLCEDISNENVDLIVPQSEELICKAEEQKCFNKCCHETEMCQNGIKCVARVTAIQSLDFALKLDCPDPQKCLDKCCNKNEMCTLGNECVVKETLIVVSEVVANQFCSEFHKCQGKCCAENEICSNGGECVVKQSVAMDCSQEQLCHGICCAENEICDSDKKCVSQQTFALECKLPQICQNKCCAMHQICNKLNECVDINLEQTTMDFLNCPLTQSCQDKCCTEYEKCSEKNKCISIFIFECQEIEKCGNKCCPVNETCNEDNECVAFLELTTDRNCPQTQKCLDSCCTPHEVCNEKYECVKLNSKNLSNLYAKKTDITNDFEAFIPLYDLNDINKPLSCASDHYPCQHQCCNAQQICNPSGECAEKIGETVCGLGQNCNANHTAVTNTKSSKIYTMIGLGFLVAILSFGLFKVYDFRRTKRNVF